MLTFNNPLEESKAGLRLKESKGAPIALIRASMGHSGVSTANGYLHARPNDSSALYLSV